MRDIRFRAWDVAIEVMHIVLGRYFSCEGEEPFSNEEIQFRYQGRWQTLEKDEYILMQYTGLKGKDGKEIYEGDILELVVPAIGQGQQYIVFWQDSIARFHTKRISDDSTDPLILSHYICNYIVIGNKFQHPDLLEKPK